ncbi:MAG: hypothetical protein NZO58_01750 [Gemmataceae bacterium]|nr:hypothetical protein [Gemmataceae bacterium]
MPIRFKCEHCHKPLSVKETLAGKRAACPACKKPILIPAPTAAPANIEDFAAAALADPVEEAPPEPPSEIAYTCVWCDEEVKFPADLAGKQAPCPSCKRIIKVPAPKIEKKKDWRTINRDGPAAARINLPEQLEGAWGTEAKSRVARETLVEAGAIEEAPAPPVGVGGWLRRGVVGVVIVLVVVGVSVSVHRNRTRMLHKNVVEEARRTIDERNKELDPKKKPSPILWAELERAAGELQLCDKKGEAARQKFMAARGLIGRMPKEAVVDHDLFLLDLARTQLDLHGTEDQVRAKERFDWEETKASVSLFKEIVQTVQRIKSPEAAVIAVRELATELIQRKQVPLALSLASQLLPIQNEGGKPGPMTLEFAALALSYGDAKKIEGKLVPPLDPKAPLDRTTRIVYAEAAAREAAAGKRDIKAALELVKHKDGAPLDRLEAAVAVASVILSDRTNKEAATQAAPFLAEAFEARKQLGKRGLPPWLGFQLVRVGIRVPEHGAAAREVLADLPASFQGRAQLECALAKAERGEMLDAGKDLPTAEGPYRALGWIVLARQAAQHNRPLPAPDADLDDPVCQAFAHLGLALAATGSKR